MRIPHVGVVYDQAAVDGLELAARRASSKVRALLLREAYAQLEAASSVGADHAEP
jgi:hypothetical protein